MKTRVHRRNTDNDVIKECKSCGLEKPHRWLKDKRRLKGGYPAITCRECRKPRIRNTTVKLPDTLRICKSCGQEESHDWIRDIRRSKGGYFRSICLKCHRRKIVQSWTEVRRAAIDYLGSKCVNCGLQRPETCIYDFHHRDPAQKKYNISDLIKARSPRQLDDMKPELDKCDLLCAICHRLKHHEKTVLHHH